MSKPKHSAVPASAPVAGEATRRGKFLPEHVTQQMIWNVQAVIEGECGGLSLDERQARNVMSFLMSEHGPDAAPQARDAALEACRLVVERFGPTERDYIFSKRMAIQKCRAALSAQPDAHKGGGDA